MSVLVAAMLHDAGHDGLNNSYHQNAATERALAFNDQSVQENYHLSTVLSRMARDPSVDIFANLAQAQAREARRLIIHMILGTDMKGHFKCVQGFKLLIGTNGKDPANWQADSSSLDQLCLNILHAADLSNSSRPFPIAHRWAEAVLEEFFVQGDREKAEGLPVSPMCSRDGTVLPASQIGFIRFVVLPYYQVLADLLPSMNEHIVPQLESNLERWKELDAETSAQAPPAAAEEEEAATKPAKADERGSSTEDLDEVGDDNHSVDSDSVLGSARGAIDRGRDAAAVCTVESGTRNHLAPPPPPPDVVWVDGQEPRAAMVGGK